MTIDHSRLPAPALRKAKGTLPAFTPVPRRCNRHDGWTPDRQRGFIEALAEHGSVKSAAHAVNMTPEGAYHLRRQDAAGEFRKAWEAALALGVQRLEDVAMDRALNGVEVPLYCYGKLVGTRRVYNDKLLMFLLRNRAPKRFAADGARGLSAMDKQTLARMKREWRKQWEREHAIAQQQNSERALEGINARLETMRQRRIAAMSDKTRQLMEAYEASMTEDERRVWGEDGDGD